MAREIELKKDTTQSQHESLKDIKELGFLSKKAEKLAGAIYIVTEPMSDKDPSKWKLRTVSLDVLSGLMTFIHPNRHKDAHIYDSVLFSISFMEALLAVSHTGSVVSRMNLGILREEFLSLRNQISSFLSRPKIETDVHEYEVNDAMLLSSADDSIKVIHKGHKRQSGKDSSLKHTINLQDSARQSPLKTNKGIRSRANTDGRKERRVTIVKFIKENGPVGIKDIEGSPDFRGKFGGKTLQRELSVLIDEGLIIRHGERRWSLYSFPRKS